MINCLFHYRKEYFLNDAKNMLQFNSENVVRVFGVCLDGLNSYLIVQEFMELGNLHEVHELEQSTIASRVSLFLLGHFQTNECEFSDFCL